MRIHMGNAIPVGRLFNIQLGIHPTWLLVYAFVTWSISSTLSELAHPIALALGAVCALTLFASVIAHELAHAICARRFGVRTRGITLFLFGGVATLESEPPTPRAETFIALAGPAASAALALAAWGAGALLDRLGDNVWVAALGLVASYLVLANGVLAAFNLVPAFPMDGGRVLRAMLWKHRKSRASATATASLVGVAFAVVLSIVGVVMVASTRTPHYVWYVVLGAFLAWMSWGNFTAARYVARMERVHVREFMETGAVIEPLLHGTFDGPTLSPSASGRDAVALFRATACTHIPVVDDGRITGVIERSRTFALIGEAA